MPRNATLHAIFVDVTLESQVILAGAPGEMLSFTEKKPPALLFSLVVRNLQSNNHSWMLAQRHKSQSSSKEQRRCSLWLKNSVSSANVVPQTKILVMNENCILLASVFLRFSHTPKPMSFRIQMATEKTSNFKLQTSHLNNQVTLQNVSQNGIRLVVLARGCAIVPMVASVPLRREGGCSAHLRYIVFEKHIAWNKIEGILLRVGFCNNTYSNCTSTFHELRIED